MLSKFPLLKVLFFYVLGIIMSDFSILPDLPYSYYYVLGILILSLYAIKKKVFKSIVLYTLFVLMGWFNTAQRHMYVQLDIEKEYSTYQVKLIEKPQEKKNSYKVKARVVGSLDTHYKSELPNKVLIYFEKDSLLTTLYPGDIIQLKTKIQEIQAPKNPNEFDYKGYLELHQTYYQCYVTQDNWLIDSRVGFSFKKEVTLIQEGIIDIIKSFKFSKKETAVLEALLAGFKLDLDQEVSSAYASAGAMHVLAVSGLHVGILYLILSQLISPFKRTHKGRAFSLWTVLFVIWSYALVTGLSDSVMRAATMFTFVHIGKSLKRETNIYNTIIASALFLLILNPQNLFMVGFQLSYIAVLGIVIIQPRLYNLLPKSKYLILDKAWSITCVSIAAQLATFPFGLYYFHQFPVLFIFSNLVVIPAVWLIMVIGMVVIPVYAIFQLPVSLLKPYQLLVEGMNSSVAFVDSISFAVLKEISISRLDLSILYLIIIFFLIGLLKRNKQFFVWSGLVVVLFMSIQFVEDYYLHRRQGFTLYSTGKETAMLFRDGNEAILIGDTSLFTNEDKMTFHIRHHIWSNDLIDVPEVGLDKSLPAGFNWIEKEGCYIQFSNKKWMIVNAEIDSVVVKKWSPDYIIVTQNMSPFKVSGQVILASALSFKNEKEWKVKNANTLTARDYAVLIKQ